MRNRSLPLRMVACLALLGAAVTSGSGPHPVQAQAFGLEGSWAMTVVAVSHPELPPLNSLVTFMRGGDVIESRRGYLPFSPFGPIQETAGHGSWRRNGLGDFSATFTFLVQAAPNNQAFTLGEPLGTDKIHLRVALSTGTSFNGTFASEARDMDGHVVFNASGTVTGTRLQVEQAP